MLCPGKLHWNIRSAIRSDSEASQLRINPETKDYNDEIHANSNPHTPIQDWIYLVCITYLRDNLFSLWENVIVRLLLPGESKVCKQVAIFGSKILHSMHSILYTFRINIFMCFYVVYNSLFYISIFTLKFTFKLTVQDVQFTSVCTDLDEWVHVHYNDLSLCSNSRY